MNPFAVTHTQTHSHTRIQTDRKVSLTACSQAVNHWIRPFYESCTAEGWSLVPVSACIPSWLTAAGQNTKAVSGKLWIKVHHLDCHQTSAAGLHAASDRDTCERRKGQLSEFSTVEVLKLRLLHFVSVHVWLSPIEAVRFFDVIKRSLFLLLPLRPCHKFAFFFIFIHFHGVTLLTSLAWFSSSN